MKQYQRLLRLPGWLEMSRDLMVQGIVQVFRSFETIITVSTYFAGTRIMAEQAAHTGQHLQVLTQYRMLQFLFSPGQFCELYDKNLTGG